MRDHRVGVPSGLWDLIESAVTQSALAAACVASRPPRAAPARAAEQRERAVMFGKKDKKDKDKKDAKDKKDKDKKDKDKKKLKNLAIAGGHANALDPTMPDDVRRLPTRWRRAATSAILMHSLRAHCASLLACASLMCLPHGLPPAPVCSAATEALTHRHSGDDRHVLLNVPRLLRHGSGTLVDDESRRVLDPSARSSFRSCDMRANSGPLDGPRFTPSSP